MSRGNTPVSIPILYVVQQAPASEKPAIGMLVSNAPKPMGSKSNGSNFLTMAVQQAETHCHHYKLAGFKVRKHIPSTINLSMYYPNKING